MEQTQLLAILIGIYLLNLADVDSNDVYRKDILENCVSFGEVMREVFKDLNVSLSEEEWSILWKVYFQGEEFARATISQISSLKLDVIS